MQTHAVNFLPPVCFVLKWYPSSTAVAVLGPGRAPPSFAPVPQFCSYPWFLAKITQISDFWRFQILEKWANLRLPLNIQKLTVFQLQGGLRPLTLWPGALPLDPARGFALMPPLQAHATALAMAWGFAPLQILRAGIATAGAGPKY